jgi:hypothetical protein
MNRCITIAVRNDLFATILNGTEDGYRNLSDSDRQLLIGLTIGSLRQFETWQLDNREKYFAAYA